MTRTTTDLDYVATYDEGTLRVRKDLTLAQARQAVIRLAFQRRIGSTQAIIAAHLGISVKTLYRALLVEVTFPEGLPGEWITSPNFNLDALEKQWIIITMMDCSYARGKVAARLGIAPKTLNRKLRKHQIGW